MMDRLLIVGGGKVGRALARAWRAAGLKITLRPARKGWPSRRIAADVVVIATRDQVIPELVTTFAERDLLGHQPVVVLHCAGALPPDVLAPLRGKNVAVGRLHPMVAIASTRRAPALQGLSAHIAGDRKARRVAKRLARMAGLRPTEVHVHDTVLYHAAAVMVAGGGVALLDAGRRLLQDAGVDPELGTAMLASLLSSVLDNVNHLGIADGLTGPVRRGDPGAIAVHSAKLRASRAPLLPLYRALISAQLDLARELGEAPMQSFDAIADLVQPS